MDTFQYKDIFLAQLLYIASVFPRSGFKIKGRKFYLFACQQITHIFIELLYVQRFQTFKIIIAVLITRCIFTV